MPLKPLSYREIKRKLETAGFEVVSQKGSHVKFAKDTSEGKRTAIVPKYKEVTIGTITSILRQAGLSVDEFERL
ncbi:MAG: type II toxin-antitoxin system HicA family toxin [Microcystis viridis Mv_BB_P_19951000_S69]|jgi:predicted RNA binding protein YcfA (HicA-like mRNA interferase family)|uniref:Type II toxin-antitoxin system HicA family toxin n=3 Tax=Microcystis TaxID=1125 RepID=A0A552I8S9_MICVR|nr:type II toxin-antitoxin system HicA family toxin [Microcystis wesenbergii]MCZ8106411.1 type II toxin-antitoxin system HicA family toxin [Burkholderiales bacterium]TRT89327.1 MAG: type II toxin-antitoxin system HicA family toxin [Microcystis aeruginosa Ma_OC_H_19870700_S124]TRU72095.1 MAG: type II toxin-antitoxin system HicA family toxin [Microcystis viridis Mv_BB_P_19951000_S69]TRU72390.1 MAG: type II toxin-antitoxin system HicA family toxin [Microcystis viridis Mv_BB_P_19951000_S68]TRU7985